MSPLVSNRHLKPVPSVRIVKSVDPSMVVALPDGLRNRVHDDGYSVGREYLLDGLAQERLGRHVQRRL